MTDALRSPEGADPPVLGGRGHRITILLFLLVTTFALVVLLASPSSAMSAASAQRPSLIHVYDLTVWNATARAVGPVAEAPPAVEDQAERPILSGPPLSGGALVVAAETETAGVSMGPGAAHISDPALGEPSEDFGPFHRLESLTQTPEVAQLQEQSGEIWGTTPRWGFEPTVQAYEGPLPEGARGVEFNTEFGPNRSAPPGQAWWQEGPGVRVEGDWAKLSCVITRNTQSC